MNRTFRLWLFSVLWCLYPGTFAGAAGTPAVGSANELQWTSFNCDFDDNIMYTTAKIMVWDTKAQQEVPVSTEDWSLVKNQLGKPGIWLDRTTRPESFRYFGDNSEHGDNVVKIQVEEAIAKGGDAFKGPSWDAFAFAMSNEAARRNFAQISARQNSRRAAMKGYQVLYDRRLISALPYEENIFNVGAPDFPEELRGDSIPASKANVIKMRLDQKEKEAAAAGVRATWGFSDDDFDNFATAKKVLAPEVAAQRWPHIKEVLFFTGRNNPNERKRIEIFNPDGTTRPPHEVYWFGLGNGVRNPLQLLADRCLGEGR